MRIRAAVEVDLDAPPVHACVDRRQLRYLVSRLSVSRVVGTFVGGSEQWVNSALVPGEEGALPSTGTVRNGRRRGASVTRNNMVHIFVFFIVLFCLVVILVVVGVVVVVVLVLVFIVVVVLMVVVVGVVVVVLLVMVVIVIVVLMVVLVAFVVVALVVMVLLVVVVVVFAVAVVVVGIACAQTEGGRF